ncbi:MAG: glycosyltransferase family 2 protein [Sphaerospermopsis sp. SIO1G1]|nr:glycosyltransferase family 2 protein [Sphaerospermopsis sp. SIO1G1]
MIVFIIPLKSQKVSKSWQHVGQLLERCIKSILSQDNFNSHVVVVYHEKPDIQFFSPNIHYIQVDFPIPGLDIHKKREDKSKKIIVGLKYASTLNPDHVMIADGDDCLNQKITSFVNNNPNSNGWFINKGYVYQEGSPFIYYRHSNFHHWCGTCNILKTHLWPLPEQDEDYPQKLIEYYSGSNHKNIEVVMRNQGTEIIPLPMLGAVYIIGNSENIFQEGFATIYKANRNKPLFMLNELRKFRILTTSIRREFGLTVV